jgi:hypothetical protein
MSRVVVQIVQDGDYRAAQPPQVGVFAGNEIEFANAGSSGTLLVLTPATESILSPKPTSPVTLAGGATVTYTFLQPAGGGYLAQVLPEGSPIYPLDEQGAEGAILTIEPSINRDPHSRTGG